ncbi:hypothetical protein, partial [Enterobacter roggenkampii]|uniref:hypothetical protein n=1 Tax=Enterobacter roggenkampii TaxID=1812935 RepID=UPI002075DBAB
ADRNRSHWRTSKTPSYTKSVSWHHYPCLRNEKNYASARSSHLAGVGKKVFLIQIWYASYYTG